MKTRMENIIEARDKRNEVLQAKREIRNNKQELKRAKQFEKYPENQFRGSKGLLVGSHIIAMVLLMIIPPLSLIPLVMLLISLFKYNQYYVEVTDKSVYHKSGIFVDNSTTTALKRIDSVEVIQKFWDTGFNIGTVVLRTGSAEVIFKDIQRPKELKEKIENAMWGE